MPGFAVLALKTLSEEMWNLLLLKVGQNFVWVLEFPIQC